MTLQEIYQLEQWSVVTYLLVKDISETWRNNILGRKMTGQSQVSFVGSSR